MVDRREIRPRPVAPRDRTHGHRVLALDTLTGLRLLPSGRGRRPLAFRARLSAIPVRGASSSKPLPERIRRRRSRGGGTPSERLRRSARSAQGPHRDAKREVLPSFRGPHPGAGFRVSGGGLIGIACLDEFGHAGSVPRPSRSPAQTMVRCSASRACGHDRRGREALGADVREREWRCRSGAPGAGRRRPRC